MATFTGALAITFVSLNEYNTFLDKLVAGTVPDIDSYTTDQANLKITVNITSNLQVS
jgi:hypothetical protein